MTAPKTSAKLNEARKFLHFLSAAGWSAKRIKAMLSKAQEVLLEDWATFEKSSREQIQGQPIGSSVHYSKEEPSKSDERSHPPRVE